MATIHCTERDLIAGVSVPIDRRTCIVVRPAATSITLFGAIFERRGAFLLPYATHALALVFQAAKRDPAAPILVVGHAERSPDTQADNALSKRRAELTTAWLLSDVDSWLSQFQAGNESACWGAREDGRMLIALHAAAGSPTLLEPTPETKKEERLTRWFQEFRCLKADGILGPVTRRRLITDYFLLTQTESLRPEEEQKPPVKVVAHGAGSGFSVEQVAAARSEAFIRGGTLAATEGRLDFFFFAADGPGVQPAPGQVSGGEYLDWVREATTFSELGVSGQSKLRRLAIAETHFRTGSAVMLPEGEAPTTEGGKATISVGAIALALRFNEECPGHSTLIAGHTDAVGSDQSNDKLSSKRAELVHAVLTGARDTFVSIADATGTVSDWKQILKWAALAFPQMPNSFAQADPGTIDDQAFTGIAPLKAFQRAYNGNKEVLGATGEDLAVDGAMGKKTWGAIFDLYEYSLREELGEDEAGVKTLRSFLKFLPAGPPSVGFGEACPVESAPTTKRESLANRRVDVMFFEQGQEPDAAVLKADPKSSEIYAPGVYQKTPLGVVSAGVPQEPVDVLRIWLLDERRQRMGAVKGSDLVLEAAFGAPYRVVFANGEMRTGYADTNGQLAEYEVPASVSRCELFWGRRAPPSTDETLPVSDEEAALFFEFRTEVQFLFESSPRTPIAVPLANLGHIGEVEQQLEDFSTIYGTREAAAIRSVHRTGRPA